MLVTFDVSKPLRSTDLMALQSLNMLFILCRRLFFPDMFGSLVTVWMPERLELNTQLIDELGFGFACCPRLTYPSTP